MNLHSAQNTRMLLNLLTISEEMLFSIFLKPDIVKKYENMREEVFDKLGLSSDFSKYWDLQYKAQDQTRQKKNLSDMEKQVLKSNLDDSNAMLSKTLICFSTCVNNFKSSLEEAGNMDADDYNSFSISLDITNYSSEVNKIEAFLSFVLRKQILLQKQCKFQQDSLNTLSCENLKIKTTTESLHRSYEESVLNLKKSHQNALEELSHKLANSKKINELEMSFHEKESKLIGQLDKISTEDASVLKNLREKLERLQQKNQELREVLKAVGERVKIVFNEFVDKEEIGEFLIQRKVDINDLHSNKVWGLYVDLLAEIDFIGYSLHKIQGDNDWLVEQLDSFSRENEDLKRQGFDFESKPKTKAFHALNSNDVVIRDFNEARNKLMLQFKDVNPNYD
jgi:hypothetical protein